MEWSVGTGVSIAQAETVRIRAIKVILEKRFMLPPRQEYIYSLQRTIPLQARGDFRPMRSLRPNRISPTGQDFSEHNCSLSRTGQGSIKITMFDSLRIKKKPKFVIMLSSIINAFDVEFI